jgi:hypothetical protein
MSTIPTLKDPGIKVPQQEQVATSHSNAHFQLSIRSSLLIVMVVPQTRAQFSLLVALPSRSTPLWPSVSKEDFWHFPILCLFSGCPPLPNPISLCCILASFRAFPVPLLRPMDDCDHPLLYLPGTGRAPQETIIFFTHGYLCAWIQPPSGFQCVNHGDYGNRKQRLSERGPWFRSWGVILSWDNFK